MRFWLVGAVSTTVRMPKTAMCKNYFPLAREYNIQQTRQGFTMEPKTQPGLMQRATELLFRFRVLGTNAMHNRASFFRCESILA